MGGREKRSKKLLGVNSDTQPEELVFFIDRSLGRSIVPEALQKEGVQVQIHDNLFPQNAPDTDWLSKVGSRNWIVLTKDAMIKSRPNEKAALMRSGVRAFILVSANLTGEEMASIFVKAIPAIKKFIAKYPAPFIAKIKRTGSGINLEMFEAGDK